MSTAESIEEAKRKLAEGAVRALARAALRGHKTAIETLKESKEELLAQWGWMPEVRELMEKGII